jgi:hypothetical protein
MCLTLAMSVLGNAMDDTGEIYGMKGTIVRVKIEF